MIDFFKVVDLAFLEDITSKNIVKVEDLDKGKTLWEAFKFRYVSLGDSIAAACNMETKQGYRVATNEYNATGSHPLNDVLDIKRNNQTKIVEDSYTDLIRKFLEDKYGKGRVDTKSFAVSGADNAFFMSTISEEAPRRAISKADLVTVCIGANEILLTAFGFLPSYFLLGDVTAFEHNLYKNLQLLAGKKIDYLDSNGNPCGYPTDEEFKNYTGSYKQIFTELEKINPKAKYVFTEVYNPYKYLYMKKGEDGFFGALVSVLPELMSAAELLRLITNQGKPDNVSDETKVKIREFIGEALIGKNSPINLMLDRINQLGDKIELYVNELNKVLRTSVNEYTKETGVNNIFVADTKRVYDSIPDGKTLNLRNVKCYNEETVACAYYDGFDYVNDTDWTRLYGDKDPVSFWLDYVFMTPYSPSGLDSDKTWNSPYKYVKYYDMVFDNPWGFLPGVPDQIIVPTFIVKDFREELFAMDVATLLVGKIIGQDIDAHPRKYGHEVLYRSFADVLRKPECLDIPDMPSLTRYTVTYNANNDLGDMSVQNVASLQKSAFVRLMPLDFERVGHLFTGWHFGGSELSSYINPDGKLKYYYINSINSNATVDAQWKVNTYTLEIVQTYKDIKNNPLVTDANYDHLDADDYGNRKLYIGKTNVPEKLNSEKTEWSFGSINEEFRVDYGTPIKISVEGRLLSKYGNGNQPTCIIHEAEGGKHVEKSWGNIVEGKFKMPAKNLRIEFWYNFALNIDNPLKPYSHRYWNAYIIDDLKEITYTVTSK